MKSSTPAPKKLGNHRFGSNLNHAEELLPILKGSKGSGVGLEVIKGGISDPRENVRSNVFLNAIIIADSSSAAVRVRNISARGALVDGGSLPVTSSAITLRRGPLSVQAQIAWRERDQCGLRFDDEINIEAWVRRIEHAGQQNVDRMIRILRSGEKQSLEMNLPPVTPDTLEAVGYDLSASCERLSKMPEMSVNLAEELVRLDTIALRLAHLVKCVDCAALTPESSRRSSRMDGV